MYGWRAKIGAVLPSNNTILEPEFAFAAPDGVTVHGARLTSTGSSAEALLQMAAETDRAVGQLLGAGVDVYLYGCLSTSLAKPPGWDGEFAQEVSRRTGRPSTTAAAATVAALDALGARRIALATPYPEDIAGALPSYFTRAGIDVLNMTSLGIADITDVPRRPSPEVYALGRAAADPDADALCVLATDLRTFEVLESLEHDLGIPVVGTNQALLWWGLGAMRIADPIPGLGTLLRRPRFSSVPPVAGRRPNQR